MELLKIRSVVGLVEYPQVACLLKVKQMGRLLQEKKKLSGLAFAHVEFGDNYKNTQWAILPS